MKTGYLAALRDGVEIVATIDADNQMNPEALPGFLDPIVDGAAEYTKGIRLHSRASIRELPNVRLFGNLLLTGLTRLASGYWDVTDSQNGYAAISRQTLERVDVEELFEYFGYPNDPLTRLHVNGGRVVDVPHDCRFGDERSHIASASYVPTVSWLLLTTFWWRLGARSSNRPIEPMAANYGASFASTLLAFLAAGSALGAGTILEGNGQVWTATAALFAASGLALFAIAIRLDILHSKPRAETAYEST